MTPTILLETKEYVVINKPAGLMVHGDGKSDEPTLADWILKTYPTIAEVGEPEMLSGVAVPRPGIVHRLDKETSGAMIIAKTPDMYGRLKKAFAKRGVWKTYYAFVFGWPKDNDGIIDAPIARSATDVRKWAAGRSKRGEERDATTEYEVIARIADGTLSEEEKGSTTDTDIAFMKFYPHTGRTHQIRVHGLFINHPLVADRLYAAQKGTALGFTRVALHAGELGFMDPSGERIRVIAPFPEDFKHAIASVPGLAEVAKEKLDKKLVG